MNNNQLAASNKPSTDALIINSNSNVVSDEIIVQLQEQFGDTKQIYILNTSNNPSSNSVQYLVVDKDVDINTILQDPALFQNTNPTPPPPPQAPHTVVNESKASLASVSSSHKNLPSAASSASSMASPVVGADESIQRVTGPPPKRKKIEYKLDAGKRMTYQDAFLRFLAGEKQPTLEISSNEHANKKPKDAIYYNFYVNSLNKSSSSSSGTILPSTPPVNNNNSTSSAPVVNGTFSNINTVTVPSTATSNSNSAIAVTNGAATNGIDKENYYNSSRRENLTPLNTYEYRNSYKDHYDNQGVRLNPAIIKNLPYSTTQTQIQSVSSPVASTSPIKYPPSKSSIVITKNSANMIVVPNEPAQPAQQLKLPIVNQNNPNIPLADHTYKTPAVTSAQNGLASKTPQPDVTEINHAKSKTPIDSVKPATVAPPAPARPAAPSALNNSETAIVIDNSDDAIIIADNTPTGVVISIPENSAQALDLPAVTVVVNGAANATSTNNNNTDNGITFTQGEFLIHKPTFSGDLENYDIWCVLDEQYLQKYEPVLLSTGERCHQSADILAQYTQNKAEFILIKVEEKGKTENDNLVVAVLSEYEPKNNAKIADELSLPTAATGTTHESTKNSADKDKSNVVVVTYDDLKSAFDVFLQVLSSQYLNNEFLIKIKDIQDEYFKPSLEFIDTILSEKSNLLSNYLNTFIADVNRKLELVQDKFNKNVLPITTTSQRFVELKQDYKLSLERNSKFEMNDSIVHNNGTSAVSTGNFCQTLNYLFDLNGLIINNNNGQDALFKDELLTVLNTELNVKYRIRFAGPTYNPDTLILDSVKANSADDDGEKSYMACSKIANLTNLLHSLKHFKFIYYQICSSKIEFTKSEFNSGRNPISLGNNNNNTNNQNNNNTEILNYCLADNQWLLEMFEKFKQLLFDVDTFLSSENVAVVVGDDDVNILSEQVTS